MANVTKQQVILEFDADTAGIDKALQQTDKQVENVSQSTSVLTNQIDKMTGGAVSGFKNAVAGTKSFIKGLKLTKAAIIGTGIGALVIAVLGLLKRSHARRKVPANLLAPLRALKR